MDWKDDHTDQECVLQFPVVTMRVIGKMDTFATLTTDLVLSGSSHSSHPFEVRVTWDGNQPAHRAYLEFNKGKTFARVAIGGPGGSAGGACSVSATFKLTTKQAESMDRVYVGTWNGALLLMQQYNSSGQQHRVREITDRFWTALGWCTILTRDPIGIVCDYLFGEHKRPDL
jgi:hypothetical protein